MNITRPIAVAFAVVLLGNFIMSKCVRKISAIRKNSDPEFDAAERRMMETARHVDWDEVNKRGFIASGMNNMASGEYGVVGPGGIGVTTSTIYIGGKP